MVQIKNWLLRIWLNDNYSIILAYSVLTSSVMSIMAGLTIYTASGSSSTAMNILSFLIATLLFVIDAIIVNSLFLSKKSTQFLAFYLKIIIGLALVFVSYNFVIIEIFSNEVKKIVFDNSFLARLDAIEQLKKENSNVQTISHFVFAMLLFLEFSPFIILLSFVFRKSQLPKSIKNPFSDGVASSFDLFGGTFGKDIEPIADFETKRGFYKDREAFKNDYANTMGDISRSFNKLKAELEYE